jgi:hypothetical protein
MASLPAVRTQVVVFDTAVVDLTEQLDDPVELLFATQLGGGMISDLYEGGVREGLLKRAASLTAAGVQMIALLALSDEGKPSYDHQIAGALASLDVPSFACTPDLFPDMMAAAISRRDLNQWAAANDVVTSRPAP